MKNENGKQLVEPPADLADNGSKDLHDLLGLLNQFSHRRSSLHDDSQPITGFAGLTECNTHSVSKIPPAICSGCLLYICPD